MGFLDFEGFLKESMIQKEEAWLMQIMHLDNLSKLSLPPSDTISVSFYGVLQFDKHDAFLFLFGPYYNEVGEALTIALTSQVIGCLSLPSPRPPSVRI